MSVILALIGVLLMANGVFLSLMSNITTGIVLTFVLGLMLFVYGIKFKKINNASKSGVFKVVRYVILTGICVELILVGFIAVYGSFDTADYTEDAVIVLGAGVIGDRVSLPLKLRLDRAVEYHSKNPDALICVTGGQGFQETVTEAYAMEKYLLSRGVDKNLIIKEEKATSTHENMKFTKAILDDVFGQNYKTVVITNGFHIYRAVSIAKSAGIENTNHIQAGLQWYNIIPCYLRESLAVIKLWVLGY